MDANESTPMKDFLVSNLTLKGRIDRWTFLRKLSRLTLLGGIILVAGLFAFNLDYRVGGYAAIAATVLVILCNLSLCVRRLHDRGHAGWWVLISLIISLFSYARIPGLIVFF